jgi:serine protease Do/serine protease DegQ
VIHFRRALAAALFATSLLSSPPGVFAQIPITVGESNGMPSLAPLLKTITPSVVSIAIRRHMTDDELAMMNDPAFRDQLIMPLPPGERSIYGAGSGVIVDADHGYIVTGSHVVEGADEIVVILNDGRRLTAAPVGSDSELDIAVVKVRAKNLVSIKMGDSEKVEVGDFVLSIGNPFSLGQTVSSGIVGALRRRTLEGQAYEDFIQTDAVINLGSSGGALINLKGELVGMNAAILDTGDPGGGNVGIGFAIPVNTVRSIANQLMTYGSATHGELGVTVTAAKQQNNSELERTGVKITAVEPDSSAARAGLKVGDIIMTINASPLREPVDFYIKTSVLRAGEAATLDIVREGRPLVVRATLTARKPLTRDAIPG